MTKKEGTGSTTQEEDKCLGSSRQRDEERRELDSPSQKRQKISEFDSQQTESQTLAVQAGAESGQSQPVQFKQCRCQVTLQPQFQQQQPQLQGALPWGLQPQFQLQPPFQQSCSWGAQPQLLYQQPLQQGAWPWGSSLQLQSPQPQQPLAQSAWISGYQPQGQQQQVQSQPQQQVIWSCGPQPQFQQFPMPQLLPQVQQQGTFPWGPQLKLEQPPWLTQSPFQQLPQQQCIAPWLPQSPVKQQQQVPWLTQSQTPQQQLQPQVPMQQPQPHFQVQHPQLLIQHQEPQLQIKPQQQPQVQQLQLQTQQQQLQPQSQLPQQPQLQPQIQQQELQPQSQLPQPLQIQQQQPQFQPQIQQQQPTLQPQIQQQQPQFQPQIQQQQPQLQPQIQQQESQPQSQLPQQPQIQQQQPPLEPQIQQQQSQFQPQIQQQQPQLQPPIQQQQPQLQPQIQQQQHQLQPQIQQQELQPQSQVPQPLQIQQQQPQLQPQIQQQESQPQSQLPHPPQIQQQQPPLEPQIQQQQSQFQHQIQQQQPQLQPQIQQQELQPQSQLPHPPQIRQQQPQLQPQIQQQESQPQSQLPQQPQIQQQQPPLEPQIQQQQSQFQPQIQQQQPQLQPPIQQQQPQLQPQIQQQQHQLQPQIQQQQHQLQPPIQQQQPQLQPPIQQQQPQLQPQIQQQQPQLQPQIQQQELQPQSQVPQPLQIQQQQPTLQPQIQQQQPQLQPPIQQQQPQLQPQIQQQQPPLEPQIQQQQPQLQSQIQQQELQPQSQLPHPPQIRQQQPQIQPQIQQQELQPQSQLPQQPQLEPQTQQQELQPQSQLPRQFLMHIKAEQSEPQTQQPQLQPQIQQQEEQIQSEHTQPQILQLQMQHKSGKQKPQIQEQQPSFQFLPHIPQPILMTIKSEEYIQQQQSQVPPQIQPTTQQRTLITQTPTQQKQPHIQITWPWESQSEVHLQNSQSQVQQQLQPQTQQAQPQLQVISEEPQSQIQLQQPLIQVRSAKQLFQFQGAWSCEPPSDVQPQQSQQQFQQRQPQTPVQFQLQSPMTESAWGKPQEQNLQQQAQKQPTQQQFGWGMNSGLRSSHLPQQGDSLPRDPRSDLSRRRQRAVKTYQTSQSEGKTSLPSVEPLQFPQRIYAAQKSGRKIEVATNFFPLTITNPEITVFHYDVIMEPGKPRYLLRRVWNEYVSLICPGRLTAFDGKNAYSNGPLTREESTTATVTVFNEEDGKDKEFKVTIKEVRRISFGCFKDYRARMLQDSSLKVLPEAEMAVLDIILRNWACDNYVRSNRTFFPLSATSPAGKDLSRKLVLRNGYFQSAFLGYSPYLIFDIAHRAFYKDYSVFTVLHCFKNIKTNTLEVDEMNHFLRNVKVEYKLPNDALSRRIYRVNKLVSDANTQTFTKEDGTTLTVAQYYAREKKCSIKYPQLPLLWVGSKQKTIYLPVEFCKIVPDQVYRGLMDSYETREMVRNATSNARVRQKHVNDLFRQTNINSHPLMKEFGLKVSDKMERVPARVLDAPGLKTSRSVRVNEGVWRIQNFLEPVQLDKWCILILDRTVSRESVMNLQRQLRDKGNEFNMRIAEAARIPIEGEPNVAGLKRAFSHLRDMEMVFVIISEGKGLYSRVKTICETQEGILTQCIKSKTLSQDPSKMRTTIENILLKVNTKLGGKNHCLDKGSFPQCLNGYVMVAGADVSHSVSGKNSPSVAAVTATCDPASFQYNTVSRIQPKGDMIKDLEEIMAIHVQKFKELREEYPEKIIFFRDGVSEGEMEKVLKGELSAVQRACSPYCQPKITFVVVQKRHRTRFYPTNPADEQGKNFNVPVGTCVDSNIVHPRDFEFYLVSHSSHLGTARPTRYRLLYDDNKLTDDELERLSYCLCHMYSKCNRSVSYPSPTFNAHLAAARVRAYMEALSLNSENVCSENFGELQEKMPDRISNISPMFFV